MRPDDDVERVAELMASEQIRRVPVVENDRLVGVIPQADVATHAGHERTGRVVEQISAPAR